MDNIPLYIDLHRTGELARRADKAAEFLKSCTLCPRECRVDRTAGEAGVCGAGVVAEVASYMPHHGEEPPISGHHGSGTIFFTHCNLKCLFCQNYDISHQGAGIPAGAEELARMMLSLQERGCHNINFVTPTHYMPQILRGLDAAAADGLRIPLVYNCGGYESLHAVKLLDGIVDIYMPDAKFGSGPGGARYADCADYMERNRAALREMFRQVGPLRVSADGVATRGLMVRHLVMPGGLADSREVLGFISRELSPDVYVSIMEQYHPAYRAEGDPDIGRQVSRKEYREVLDAVKELEFTSGWVQGDPFFFG